MWYEINLKFSAAFIGLVLLKENNLTYCCKSFSLKPEFEFFTQARKQLFNLQGYFYNQC